MSLRDKLVGPTEEEVLYNLKDLTPIELLHKSCKIGLLKGVELALEKGVNIHSWNDTSLRLSSIYGYTEIVKLLLEKGADVHVDNDYPLKMSKKYGHIETQRIIENDIINKNLIL